MKLRDLLQGASKAQLQGYFVHWFPGREVLSARDRLSADLEQIMTDPVRARDRFDALSRSQRGFVTSLLVREGCEGTVAQVRTGKHGRAIEDFEVEGVLKSLHESGYIVKTGGTGGYDSETFGIPEELARALQRTVAVEERHPGQMLTLAASQSPPGVRGGPNGAGLADPRARVEALGDPKLKALVLSAVGNHLGVLTHSLAGEDLSRTDWRLALERNRVGTVGVLSLKDYGIDLEEEALIVYQEVARDLNLQDAQREPPDHDVEVSLGVDLLIDIDRALEVLRTEPIEVTREGAVYKKVEDRISPSFVTARRPELQDGAGASHIFDLCRRLRVCEEEGQRLLPDTLRRRAWRRESIERKLERVFELYHAENRGTRWSFHQAAIRDLFLDRLTRISAGSWQVARPFLSAVLSTYLQSLDDRKVAEEFQLRCTGDFKHETLVVPLPKLYHDLCYWAVHRMGLLGLLDLGYKDGGFHSFRLSHVGRRFLERRSEAARAQDTSPRPNGAAPEPGKASPVAEGAAAARPGPDSRVHVNPDFELLVYPETREEVSWFLSFFADRVDSGSVKRYRLTRESVQRGIISGLGPEEILGFIRDHAYGSVPPNVAYSLAEWTEGVELVRRQKVALLRATRPEGARRLVEILERHRVPYELVNGNLVVIQAGKHERALEELQQQFHDNGLFVE